VKGLIEGLPAIAGQSWGKRAGVEPQVSLACSTLSASLADVPEAGGKSREVMAHTKRHAQQAHPNNVGKMA